MSYEVRKASVEIEVSNLSERDDGIDYSGLRGPGLESLKPVGTSAGPLPHMWRKVVDDDCILGAWSNVGVEAAPTEGIRPAMYARDHLGIITRRYWRGVPHRHPDGEQRCAHR